MPKRAFFTQNARYIICKSVKTLQNTREPKRPAATPNRLQAGCAVGGVRLQRIWGISRWAVHEGHTNTRMAARCIRVFVTGFVDGKRGGLRAFATHLG